MRKAIEQRSYATVTAFALSLFAVCLLFVWEGSKGLNLWDEGFLWYGVQRVMQGEVPIRDFMAYDPGRYYWSAGLMSLWRSSGILSLRVSVAVFQAAGLFTGLLLVVRSIGVPVGKAILPLFISAVTLATWMFPRHKLFDVSLCLFLIGSLSCLVDRPTPKRYFMAGFVVGLVALFGRNHGLYGAASSMGVIVWLSLHRESEPQLLKSFAIWMGGVIAGFSPLIVMLLIIPGFATSFLESLRLLLEQQATNLPLPVPWPWRVNLAEATASEAVRQVFVGLFFIATLLFGVLAVLWCFRQRLKRNSVQPAFVAAAFLALPYAHFAFSRADMGHLAQGVFPLLVGSFVLIYRTATKGKWPLAVGLCLISLWTTCTAHPGWQCLVDWQCVNVSIGGDQLAIDPSTADDVATIHEVVDRYASNGQNFLITPYWPGAYALVHRRSPIWDIYALVPRTKAFEEKEIERIQVAKPVFALIMNAPLDGREELRFPHTHPFIYKYIVDNFKRVSADVKLPNELYLASPPQSSAN